MKLELSNAPGFFAKVSPVDWARVRDFNWHLYKKKNRRYAKTKIQGKIHFLHRFILDFPSSSVDHIDGNGLNNCRSNLRLCSHQENCRNQKKRADAKTSRFKGVCWSKRLKKWIAQISLKVASTTHLGCFDSEIKAAQAYNKFASQYFGKFAKLNLI